MRRPSAGLAAAAARAVRPARAALRRDAPHPRHHTAMWIIRVSATVVAPTHSRLATVSRGQLTATPRRSAGTCPRRRVRRLPTRPLIPWVVLAPMCTSRRRPTIHRTRRMHRRQATRRPTATRDRRRAARPAIHIIRPPAFIGHA